MPTQSARVQHTVAILLHLVSATQRILSSWRNRWPVIIQYSGTWRGSRDPRDCTKSCEKSQKSFSLKWQVFFTSIGLFCCKESNSWMFWKLKFNPPMNNCVYDYVTHGFSAMHRKTRNLDLCTSINERFLCETWEITDIIIGVNWRLIFCRFVLYEAARLRHPGWRGWIRKRATIGCSQGSLMGAIQSNRKPSYDANGEGTLYRSDFFFIEFKWRGPKLLFLFLYSRLRPLPDPASHWKRCFRQGKRALGKPFSCADFILSRRLKP